MRTITTLSLALSACAASKSSVSNVPDWLSEECSQARLDALRILEEGGGPKDYETLQAAVGRLKQSCKIVNENEGDVIGVLMEDFAELIRGRVSCAQMLEDFNKIPEVCGGIPNVNLLLRRCGQRHDGQPTWAMDPQFSAEFVASGGGEFLQTHCVSGGEMNERMLYIERFKRPLRESFAQKIYSIAISENLHFATSSDPQDFSGNEEERSRRALEILRRARQCTAVQINQLFERNPICPPRRHGK